jgi:hypothetical protein
LFPYANCYKQHPEIECEWNDKDHTFRLLAPREIGEAVWALFFKVVQALIIEETVEDLDSEDDSELEDNVSTAYLINCSLLFVTGSAQDPKQHDPANLCNTPRRR